METTIELMNNKMIAGAVISTAAFFFITKTFFVSDEDKIRFALSKLELLFSKSEQENALELASKVTEALNYFAPIININVNYLDEKYERTLAITDRDKLKQFVSGMKFKHDWFKVTFEDTNIVLQGNAADSRGTFRIKFRSPQQGRVYMLFDIDAHWIKSVKERWMIEKINATAVIDDEQ